MRLALADTDTVMISIINLKPSCLLKIIKQENGMYRYLRARLLYRNDNLHGKSCSMDNQVKKDCYGDC